MADDSRNVGTTGSDDEGDDAGGKGGGRSKSRRELPAGAVATLKAWLLSPEHFTHPYPTPQDQAMLMQKTGIDKKQLKNWFTNARRRIWKPMLKKQIEQGKLTSTGAGGGVAVPGVVVPGALMVPAIPGQPTTAPGGSIENPHSIQAVRAHYQQAVQQGQQATVDAFGNQVYVQAPVAEPQISHHGAGPIHPGAPPQHSQPPQPPQPIAPPQANAPSPAQFYGQSDPTAAVSASSEIRPNTSIGSLPPLNSGTGTQLSKTDSHAVLMELFARDQDLVRQATESARMKAVAKNQNQTDGQQQMNQQQSQGQQISSQHPMKLPHGRIGSVPSLNSWPHFSSISSLNNLGTMPGVKSITSLSGADLASQGNVNKMGNLAQLKSMESMGKNDSYAFLEVFFGDRSLNNMSAMGPKDQKGIKREREEDNDVGLSLEDESPSTNTKQELSASETTPVQTGPLPAPLTSMGKDSNDNGTLKRAYDDALAARGLISVSRSSEKLTDLALPAKVRRTLSQEFIRQQPQQQGQPLQSQPQIYTPYSYNAPSAAPEHSTGSQIGCQQYPGQHPGEPMQSQQYQSQETNNLSTYMSDPSESNASVEVPSATKCALCQQINVDTQLRPCGHMFHERCLKPSLQTPMGPPKCPVDHIPMQSALLAIPTDEPSNGQVSGKNWNTPSAATPGQPLPLETRGSTV